MLHTMFQGHWSIGSREEDFLSFLPYMGGGGGRSGGAMVLGKLPVPGRPTILMIVGKGLLRLQ